MRALKSISIRQKLLLVSLAASATALLLASAAFIVLGLSIARRASVHKAESLLAVVGTLSALAIQSRDTEETRQILALLEDHPEVLVASLYTLDGEPLVTYHRADLTPPESPPLPEDYPWRFRDGHLELFRLVPPAGTARGRVYLQYDPIEYRAWLRRYAWIVIGVILIPFGLAWLLSSRLRDIVSRPILELAMVAEHVRRKKDYSLRARKESDDELGTLIDAFNAMLGRIQERDQHLQEAREQLEHRVTERTSALRQQFTRIDLLNQINRAIAQRQDLDSILHVVLGQLESRFSIDFGCIHLCDPESGDLKVAAARTGPSIAPARSLDRDALSADRTEFPTSMDDDLCYTPDLAHSANLRYQKLAEAGLGSAVALPLRVVHELFGVLTVARVRRDAFDPDEYDCLRSLAEQVAVAGHQARLHAELRDAYEEIRRTQQAVMQQDRLRALGQMASGIAHDINNALSPVSGFAELLLLTERNLGPNGRKYLGHIKTAGDDVAEIVARLREFYRARPADQPLARVPINPLLEQVIDLTRPRWRDISQQKGVAIEVKADFDPADPEMGCAESELREALTNLVFNAIDAMPDGGTITLRSRLGAWLSPSPSDSHQSPTHVVIEVVDTGTGMDDEVRQRCLEPFFSTKGQRGTGLGLAMVYGVVQRHQGCIEIESAPGNGTTFRLILPVGDLPAGSADESAAESEPLPPLRILFVDDEPLVRDLVRDMLEHGGHRVTLADGGQAGLDAFFNAAWRSQPFDAVITDLGMPHLDGRQLAHILKREAPQTPVIMMTGWGSLLQGEHELRAPVDCLLSKPPCIGEIENALRQTLLIQSKRNS